LQTGSTLDTFTYIEDTKTIPYNTSLKLYLTTFSDKTAYDNTVAVYSPDTQRWNNFLQTGQSFFVITQEQLPIDIKAPNGFPLKHKILNGISSEDLSLQSKILKSFTATFFMKFNDLTFTKPDSIEIFNIYVESPDYVRLYLKPITDANNVINPDNIKMVCLVGDSTNEITLKKDDLRAYGKNIAFSFVYDADAKPSPIVHFYLGDIQFDKELSSTPNLRLGTSRIQINGSSMSTLDANLHAFMLFTSPLTLAQHKEVVDYLNAQEAGTYSLLDKFKQLTSGQLAAVQHQLADQSNNLADLQNRLNQCTANITPATAPAFAYTIPMPGDAVVTAADLASCSVLKVKNRLDNVPTPAPAPGPAGSSSISPSTGPSTSVSDSTTSPSTSTTPASTTSSTNSFQINIPFLEHIIGKEADLTKVARGYFTRP
jgi:hypothetical protein